MPKINYLKDIDDLEIIFKSNDIPEVIKLQSGITLEFDSEQLTAIILPHFFQMLHRQYMEETIEFMEFNDNMVKLKLNEQIINIKIDLSEIEN